MPANIDALIQEAQSALKANRKADARRALDTALSIDEMSENAWLLMSKVVDAESDQLTCLENVLSINPNNMQAQQMVATIQGGSRPAPFAAPAPMPFQEPPDSDGWGDWAGMDVPAPVPPPAAAPSKPSISTNTPSSVEWGRPADTGAADQHVVGQPSDADYDSWMAGLSLGGSGSSSGSSKPSSSKQSGGAGLVPAFDTSDFDSGPFSTTSFEPFDSGSDSSTSATASRGPAAASPFGGFSFDDTPAPAATSPQQNADPFGLRRGTTASSSTSPATPPPATTGSAFSLKGAEPPALAAARKRQETEQGYDYQSQRDEEEAQAEQQKKSAVGGSNRNASFESFSAEAEPPSSSAAVFTTIDSTPGMANPSSYFSAIPDDIRNGNKLKPALVASLIGLVVLNLVSLAFLLSNLAANGTHPTP
jgi:hypothetical protein